MSIELVEVIHSIREQLSVHGLSGMRRLGMAFSVNDRGRTGFFDFQEFEAIIGKAGIFIKRQLLTSLYRYFDRSHSERIYYPDFLRAVQGTLSKDALTLVRTAFNKLVHDYARYRRTQQQNEHRVDDDDNNNNNNEDVDINGVDIDYLLSAFDPSTHPHVLSGQKTVAVLRREFQEAMTGAGTNNNGIVTLDEFTDYVAAMQASIQQDYFPLLISRGFGLPLSSLSSSSSSPVPSLLSRLRALVIEKVRQKSLGSLRSQEQLRLAFKYFDLHHTGYLSYTEFLKALERYGIVLDAQTSKQLFDAFAVTPQQQQQQQQLQSQQARTSTRTFQSSVEPRMNYAEFAAALYEDTDVSAAYTTAQRSSSSSSSSSSSPFSSSLGGASASASASASGSGRVYQETDKVLLSMNATAAANNAITSRALSSRSQTRPSSRQKQGPLLEPLSVPPTVVFVVGGPFSGVESVCSMLTENAGFVHIDMSQANSSNSDLVDLLASRIAASSLPSSSSSSSSSSSQQPLKVNKYFVVSSFPSTLSSWSALNARISTLGYVVPFALYLDAPSSVLYGRAQQQQQQQQGGKGVNFNDFAFKQTLSKFEAEELPVVEMWQKQGKLRIVNASGTREQLWQQVLIQLQQI